MERDAGGEGRRRTVQGIVRAAGAGCRTLVIPPSLPTMRRTAGALG